MDFKVLRWVLSQLGFLKDQKEISPSKIGVSLSIDQRSPNSPRSESGINFNAGSQAIKREQKVENLWKTLGGEFFGHVTLNNLRMLLLAIKGLHVQPEVRKSAVKLDSINLAQINQVEGHINNPYLGVFNQNGDMILNENDVDKAIHLFADFDKNHQLFEQDQLLLRKKQRESLQLHSFRPFVSEKNSKLASKSRSRQILKQTQTLHDEAENSSVLGATVARTYDGVIQREGALKIPESQAVDPLRQATSSPMIERLTRPTLSPKWIEQEQKKLELSLLKECTFRPEISKQSQTSRNGKKKANKANSLLDGNKLLSDKIQHTQASQLPSQNQKSVQRLNLQKVFNNQDPMKFRSKDLMEQTGNKFNDLYLLSKKIDFIKPKRDKSTDEIEYQKSKVECTFVPSLASQKKRNRDREEKFSASQQIKFGYDQLRNIRGSLDLNSFEKSQFTHEDYQKSQLKTIDKYNEQQKMITVSQSQNVFSLQNDSCVQALKSQTNNNAQEIKKKQHLKYASNLIEIAGVNQALERQKKSIAERELIKQLKSKGLFLNQKNLRQEVLTSQTLNQEQEAAFKVKPTKLNEKQKNTSVYKKTISKQIQMISDQNFANEESSSQQQFCKGAVSAAVISKKNIKNREKDNQAAVAHRFAGSGGSYSNYSISNQVKGSVITSPSKPSQMQAATATVIGQSITESHKEESKENSSPINNNDFINYGFDDPRASSTQNVNKLELMEDKNKQKYSQSMDYIGNQNIQNKHCLQIKENNQDCISSASQPDSFQETTILRVNNNQQISSQQIQFNQYSEESQRRLENGADFIQQEKQNESKDDSQSDVKSLTIFDNENKIDSQQQSQKREANEESPSPKSKSLVQEEQHQENVRPSTEKNNTEEDTIEPLLYIDVNITPTHTERLQVFAGDTPEQLAGDFCKLHQLPEKMQLKLIKLLKLQIEELQEQYNSNDNIEENDSKNISEQQ